jgi:DNA mismatch repair ATPase MutS
MNRGEKAKMTFLYKAENGICEEEHYGIQVAEMAGMDASLIERAHEISKELKKAKSPEKRKKNASVMVKRLLKARECWKGSEEDLRVYLKQVWKDYRQE